MDRQGRPRPRPRKRRPRRRQKWRWLQPLAALFLVIFSIFAVMHYFDLSEKEQRLQELQMKNEQLLKENEMMEQEQKKLQDPKYIEGVARDQLGLVKPGEAPYIH